MLNRRHHKGSNGQLTIFFQIEQDHARSTLLLQIYWQPHMDNGLTVVQIILINIFSNLATLALVALWQNRKLIRSKNPDPESILEL